MKACREWTDVPAIVGGSESRECLRPQGHEGPHLIQRENGAYIVYEINILCRCSVCRKGKEELLCRVFREVTEHEALCLMGTESPCIPSLWT